MGGTSTKFRKHLQRGDEYAALQLCERHPELRKSLDPNCTYGEQYGHNTPLHYASRHCMKALIRFFLNDLGGNPNKKNAEDATSVHLICQGGTRMSRNLDGKLRSECLAQFLAWEGPLLANGDREKANIDAVDFKGNSALHYAAASGLKRCVEMLVCRGAKLTVENIAKETPCDSAERCGYRDIAEYLETKMVFSSENHEDVNEEDVMFPACERFNGLREQDLIEAKDMLLVETSDMLQVPLFTAEALLRNHEWSRDSLWVSWNRDPVVCCERCGVQPPLSAIESIGEGNMDSVSQDTHSQQSIPPSPSLITCEICCTEIMDNLNDGLHNTECGHLFCKNCWKQLGAYRSAQSKPDVNNFYGIDSRPSATPCLSTSIKVYATVKIQDGDLHSISCPAYSCSKLVPLELIEQVVSPSMARKYLKFDIKAFVESNPLIKWCPYPGCTNAVRLPDMDDELPMYLRAFPKIQPPPPTSKTVYCPQGHPFCWDCLMKGHEPTCCAKWKEWHEKIAEIKPEELSDTGSASESAANCLWLVTHSKPCPKCKSPIQKNEGCNHMKCSKCKHDFCWVCLGQWKKHSTETGGYFRCNRYDDSRKVEEKTEQAIAEAKEQSRRAQELNRFVHYYSRYKNHLNSFKLEKGLYDRVEAKVELLAKSAEAGAGQEEEMIDFSFVNQAIQELLRSRKVLSSSYAYGYFLKDCGYNKTIFEYLQDDWVKSGMPPLEDVDPSRPWVKDTRGRHHNLLAILDWPDEEGSDEESQSNVNTPTSSSGSLCGREGCSRQRARNPRTGELHPYCSLKCQWRDNAMDEECSGSATRQYNVDLMIALQMSRIQLLQDLKVLCDDDDDENLSASSIGSSSKYRNVPDGNLFLAGEDIDPDVQLAIERSVSESNHWLQSPGSNKTDSSTVHLFLKSLADKPSSAAESAVNMLDDKTEKNFLLPDKKCDKVLLQEIEIEVKEKSEQTDSQ